MSDNIDEVIAAPIFSHAQFKGDDFTAREIARTIRAALRSHGLEVVKKHNKREQQGLDLRKHRLRLTAENPTAGK